jgi:hypothetical protein
MTFLYSFAVRQVEKVWIHNHSWSVSGRNRNWRVLLAFNEYLPRVLPWFNLRTRYWVCETTFVKNARLGLFCVRLLLVIRHFVHFWFIVNIFVRLLHIPWQVRDLCLITHKAYHRQTSMPPVGFEPAILTSERSQTLTLKTSRPLGSARECCG